MIPEKLYRGDADRKNCRQLKTHLKNGLLFTNLISGGNGSIVFKKPLVELVKEHISPGSDKTHFLSFSELEERAFDFGSYGFDGDVYPFYEEESNWDFALLTFDTSHIISCNLIDTGVYKCHYKTLNKEFDGSFNFVFINTVEYLNANTNFNTESQIKNAERDKEWLMLPTNEVLLNSNLVEYSAKIDMGNAIDFMLFTMK